MRAVGCHAYAGGFSYGMRSGGFTILAHLEPGAYKGFGVESSKANIGVECAVGEDNWRGRRFRGCCDVVYGNPPCAAYSNASAGAYGPWREERRGHAFTMLQLLNEIAPRAWVMESVPGILSIGAGVVAALQKASLEAGYSFTIWKHDHRFLNAAQRRARVYLIAHNFDLQFPLLGEAVGQDIISVRQALSTVVDPGPYREFKPKLRAVWEVTPPGRGPRDVDLAMRGGNHSTFSVMDIRLPIDIPSPTLLGDAYKYAHPTENRHIGLFEFAKLCSYPDTWKHVSKNPLADMAKASIPSGGAALAPILIKGIERNEPPRWRVAVIDQHAAGSVDTRRCRNTGQIIKPVPNGIAPGPVALSRSSRSAEQLGLDVFDSEI